MQIWEVHRKKSERQHNSLPHSPHIERMSLLTGYFVGGITKASLIEFNGGSLLRAISPFSNANFSHNINFADRRASIPILSEYQYQSVFNFPFRISQKYKRMSTAFPIGTKQTIPILLYSMGAFMCCDIKTSIIGNRHLSR